MNRSVEKTYNFFVSLQGGSVYFNHYYFYTRIIFPKLTRVESSPWLLLVFAVFFSLETVFFIV